LAGHKEKTDLNLDTRVLSEFIYALNIARRQILSYPTGHPVINAAAEKLLNLLPQMFEFRQHITIGVARDTLLVGNQALDNTNPIYRDFAKNLFDAKVASLTINKDVTASEICKFFELLRYKPEELADRGGLHRVLTLSDIKGLSAQGVDFGAFYATEVSQVHAPKSKLIEDESVVLWKSFVGGLVAGTLDPNGEKLAPDAQLDPELLAEIMNREEGVEGQGLIRNYEEAITSFLKETDRNKLQSQASQETLRRLGDLVGNLKPDLRRRFLNSTLKSCSGRQEMAQHGGGERGGGRVAGKRERSSEETTVLLGQLFSADQADKFVPDDYQDALAVLAAAETLPGLDRKQVDELVETLDGHAVERHLCNVMFDLLDRGVNKMTATAISRNMEELIFYFLETGDFVSLVSVHDHLSRHARQVEEWLETPEKSALHIFSREEFVEHVLDSLDTWGKAKYGSIKSLIKRVKKPFVDPLLELLVQESSMSKRRLFMECLHVVGIDAREQIEARLHDRRWFFVRNLVVLLRGMEDPSVLKALGRLVGYANATVQFEVMRTFIHFNDPRADRYLIKELDSKDPGVLLQAARLAANSSSPEVATKLSGVLNRKLLNETDENVKSTAIKALAEMARPEALPGLRQFLHSRSLLQSFQSNSLKIEAVKTLVRYDSPDAVGLAEEVYRKASGELARAAGQVCLQKRRKLP
jgi:hypothetical protein